MNSTLPLVPVSASFSRALLWTPFPSEKNVYTGPVLFHFFHFHFLFTSTQNPGRNTQSDKRRRFNATKQLLQKSSSEDANQKPFKNESGRTVPVYADDFQFDLPLTSPLAIIEGLLSMTFFLLQALAILLGMSLIQALNLLIL